MKYRWPLKATLEVALWVGVIGFVLYRIGPQIGAAFGVGDAGPTVTDVEVQTLAGESVRLSDLRGQVVLVNFWATWCPPCRIEMPGFENVYRKHAGDGFTVLALSTDRGPRDVVGEFVEEHGLTFPVAMATAEARRAFGAGNMLPTSYLIDRRGRIRHTVQGFFAQPALELAVDRLLAEDEVAASSQSSAQEAR